ncbi:MAG: hypothetical protein ACP5IL_15245 [Syntrophobacteraceae bacterium]
MREEKTIRRTLRERAAGFETINAAVFTTFNFVPEFFEKNVLPALFDIESRSEACQRAEVNHRLLHTEVCVLYDASTHPDDGGHYRYQRVGVFRRNGFFHPKLMIVAGIRQHDNRPCLYLATASANLSTSGWGKNQEVIGEAWIGSKQQKLFSELRDALKWLRVKGAAGTRAPIPAIDRCLQFMDGFGERTNIEGSTGVSFYFSPLQKEGFLSFFQQNQTAKWDELLVLSPYWADVAENAWTANASSVKLVPAFIPSKGKYGLGRKDLPEDERIELLKLARPVDDRFWHAKAYILNRKNRARFAIGSGNFTGAGLSGGEKGNVEAMLVYEEEAGTKSEFLPDLIALQADEIPEDSEGEGPETVPMEITVVYDWKSREYRIAFQPPEVPGFKDYRLILPGRVSILIDRPHKLLRHADPQGPLNSTVFRLHYIRGEEPNVFSGLINEINPDFGDKPYFRALSLTEILESWRLPSDRPPVPPEYDDPLDIHTEPGTDDANSAPPGDRFNILNLYEMYRGFYALRRRLDDAMRDNDPAAILGYLVTRPDSVYHLARQMGEKPDELPLQRFLVLLECQEVMTAYRAVIPRLDRKFSGDVTRWVASLREIVSSMHGTSHTGLPLGETISWFENELKRGWRR